MIWKKMIDEAVEKLQSGEVICIPTETVYGMAVDAGNLDAIERLYKLKGRRNDKPTSIAIQKPSDIYLWTNQKNANVHKLINLFWPGPLTLLVSSKNNVSHKLTRSSHKIGLRCSSNHLVQKIITLLGRPICLTSANLSGEKDGIRAADIRSVFGDCVFLVEDDKSIYGIPSTILDVSSEPYFLIREGAVSLNKIREALVGVEIKRRF